MAGNARKTVKRENDDDEEGWSCARNSRNDRNCDKWKTGRGNLLRSRIATETRAARRAISLPSRRFKWKASPGWMHAWKPATNKSDESYFSCGGALNCQRDPAAASHMIAQSYPRWLLVLWFTYPILSSNFYLAISLSLPLSLSLFQWFLFNDLSLFLTSPLPPPTLFRNDRTANDFISRVVN